MNNVNMANMGAMGGPVGPPMGMMNNQGAIAPPGAPRQLAGASDSRMLLNTYIYEYFLRFGMFDCARVILESEPGVNVSKDSPRGRRDGNGNPLGNGLGDDHMDTDTKDGIDAKRPDDLPDPVVPNPSPEGCFLYDWFCLFWDIFHAQKGKGNGGIVQQYVSHTQAQSRMRQAQQQDMLRQMRPETFQQQQQFMMRNMQNGAMMNMKQGNNLPRTAMANSQNNPQMQMLQQKQGQMSRDPSDMDGNRQRPSSPGSTDNAPSPKRPRIDGGQFNPNQAGMLPNGRPVGQGMPNQQVGNGSPTPQQVQQMLLANNINPAQLNPDQLQTFTNQSPAVQAKTIASYAQNLQQHHNQQLPNKPMPNATGPQAQGSPMGPQGPDGAGLGAYYNAGEMGGPGAMRPGPGAAQGAGGSNHALQDYQMQLMLLEQQNKKRLMMARQEQDGITGIARPDGVPAGPGGPGAPQGPNAQQFQGASPPGGRTGASPNPAEQMKRNNQQIGAAGMGSPLPENPHNRNSPNPVNFIGANMDPNMAPNFFKGMNNMDGNMAGAQMNGMRPPSSHPGQQFNGQMNQQQMMARQQQQQQQQQAGQGGPQMQWQQGGPNGNQMGPQGPQAQQVQGTPQQRAMPPPSAPGAANANQRTQTASPQVSNAAPPTPQQSTKANPNKKKNEKGSKGKGAAQKKSNSNLNSGATPAAEAPAEPEPPTPATPITPVNPQSFNKANQNAGAAQVVPNGQPAAPAPQAPTAVAPPPHADPTPNTGFGIDSGGLDFGSMDFANPINSSDVLQDFDFDSFLHDGTEDPGAFDFSTQGFGMEGTGEIGAD